MNDNLAGSATLVLTNNKDLPPADRRECQEALV